MQVMASLVIVSQALLMQNDLLDYPNHWELDGQKLIGKSERKDDSSFHPVLDVKTGKRSEINGAVGAFQHFTTFTWTMSKQRLWSFLTHGRENGFHSSQIVYTLEVTPLHPNLRPGRCALSVAPFVDAIWEQARARPSRVFLAASVHNELMPELIVLSDLPHPKAKNRGSPFNWEQGEPPAKWNLSFHTYTVDPDLELQDKDWRMSKAVTCPFSEAFVAKKVDDAYYFVTSKKLFVLKAGTSKVKRLELPELNGLRELGLLGLSEGGGIAVFIDKKGNARSMKLGPTPMSIVDIRPNGKLGLQAAVEAVAADLFAERKAEAK